LDNLFFLIKFGNRFDIIYIIKKIASFVDDLLKDSNKNLINNYINDFINNFVNNFVNNSKKIIKENVNWKIWGFSQKRIDHNFFVLNPKI
jgi:hypothetical protein